MSQRAAYALIALVLASCMPSSSTGTTDDAVVSGPSVDGSVIPTVAKIVDSAANTWTVSAGVVYENGKLAGFSDGVTKLLYINGVIYQENSANNFWSWGGSTWVQTADPRNVSGSESNVPAMPLLVDASLNL